MRNQLNIHRNLAIIICLLFIFRILLINIQARTYAQSSQNNFPPISKTLTKDQSATFSIKSNYNQNRDIEICEEKDDLEEDWKRFFTYALISNFNASFRTFNVPVETNTLFDLIKCYLYPKKYLALSILRI